MKKKFTFLIAALMLLTMISQPTRLWGQTYKKVTSAPTGTDTWDGDYVFVYESSNTAYVWTGVDGTNCYATASISSGVITKPSGAVNLTIASVTGGYSIKVNGGDNDGKYIKANKSSATISFANSASAHTLGVASIKENAQSKYLKYNSASDQKRFRYYASGQQSIQLYRKAYTVTYNANGGSGSMTDANSPYFENSTVTTLSNTFTNGTQSFTGWNTKADGSGQSYAEGATFTITENTTLYAQWASATAVADPTFSPAAGTYVGTQSVVISCATAGATIYYTTDGSTPNTSSSVYSSAISVSSSQTIKALAVKDGLTDSEVVSATYTIKVAIPTFSPAGGDLFQTTSVSITCETVGASIYYTTDGTDPTSGSTLYSSAISVSSAQTIKAIAIKSGLTNSDVATATYTFPTVKTVAEARAYPNTTDYFYTRGVMTYKADDGKTAYIQDATAAIAIYKNDNTFTSGLSVGDEIVVYGKKTTYHGLVEVGTATIVTTLSTGNTVSPTVKTVAAINSDYGSGSGDNNFQSMFVKIEKATYNGSNSVTQSGSSITVEGTMGNAGNGDAVTFTGIIGCYDGVKIINLGNVVVVNDPFVSVSPSTASAFSYIVGNGPSAAQSFTVTGTYLTDDDIIVSVPSDSDFEIKTGTGEYTNSLTLASGDSFYVRMKSGKTDDEATYSTTLTIENDGADDVNIALSGSVSYLSVTYDGNGAGVTNVPTDATNYTYNQQVTVLGPGTMARTGYDFVEWNTESNGTGDDYEKDDTFDITEDVTLYAQWTAKSYSITADPAITHGSISFTVGGVANSTSAKTGETVTIVLTPDSGYGLTSVSVNSGAVTVTNNTFVMPASDVTVSATFVLTATDELTASLIGQSSYGNWSGKYHVGEAVYAGNSTTGGSNSSSIQLRDNTNSGIVTTTSGGTARKVSVTWNSSTTTGRTLQVYGKNQAYSGTTGASDLYDVDKRGTLIGTIVYGTSTELTINDNYGYIGMRSSSGAMYLDEIEITWAAPTHALTYDANGGTGTMTDPSSPYKYNASVTVLAKANTITAPSGKMFARWDTNAEGNGTSYAPDDIFSMPKNDMTLYAIWEDECNETATMAATSGTKEYVNDAGELSFKINLSSKVTALSGCADITEYGFVYSTNGTTPTVGDANCTKIVKGTEYTTANTVFEHELTSATLGATYKICSYATNLAGTAYGTEVTVVIDDDYPSYTISYSTNGTSEASTTKIYQGNAISDLITPANVPAGYSFRGWYGDDYDLNNSAPTFVKNGDAISGNLTLKAVFAIGTTSEGEFTKSYGFETASDDDWTIDGPARDNTNPNTGSYAGKINTNNTYVTFNNKVKVKEFSFAFTRASNNNNYNVYIETKTDNTAWAAAETYAMSGFNDDGTYKTKTKTFDGTTELYVRFHCYNTTAVRYVDDVTITYDAEVTTYSNYCTSVSTQTDAITDGTITAGHLTTDGTITAGTAVYLTSPLTIDNGVKLTVNGAIGNANPANLIIEDGGQLILPKTNTGVKATVKKETKAATAKDTYYWYAISSAVENPSISSATNLITETSTPYHYDLYRFNEAKNADKPWENYRNAAYSSSFTTLEKGRGYIYRNASDLSIAMTGEVNVADFDYPVTKTGSDVLAGFNLIGNPYSHNIYKGEGTAIPNGDDFLRIGFYYMDPTTGKWTTGTDGSTVIKPNEAILVQTDANGNIEMTNTTANAAKYNNDNIMFRVANSQYSDEAYAWFGKGRGLNKISHRNAEVPMLYIRQDGEDYAIATMGDDTKVFSLNFKATATGKYTLSYKTRGEFSYLHVIDRFTGEDVDMLLEGEYSFVASPIDSDARFIVKLAYLPDYSDGEGDIFAYQNGSDIFVSGEGELQIFDVMGRFVMSERINGVKTMSADDFAKGVYIFRLNEKTQKMVIK